jgi:hypothetical protein
VTDGFFYAFIVSFGDVPISIFIATETFGETVTVGATEGLRNQQT